MSDNTWTVKPGISSLAHPRRKDNKILLLNLGREHDDTQQIADTLGQVFDYRVDRLDVTRKDLAGVDFSNVAAVDLKDCRGWQNRYDFFQDQMKILSRKIKETGREIPIVNPPKMFNWSASKEYLLEFKNKGITIVPTKFVHRGEKWPDIEPMLEGNPDKTVVLKPARGARNSNILFVKKIGEDEYTLTNPKPLDESPTPHVMTVTRKVLGDYLQGYAAKLFYDGHEQQQPAILIQPFTRGKEISAVMLGGTTGRPPEVRFVERTVGEQNPVAHEDFGGQNLPMANPDRTVTTFARQVRDALPPDLQNSPYIRIDMLYEQGKKPALLEVEAGSARLFLIETNRTDEYAQMLNECIIKARLNSRTGPSGGVSSHT